MSELEAAFWTVVVFYFFVALTIFIGGWQMIGRGDFDLPASWPDPWLEQRKYMADIKKHIEEGTQ